MKTIDTIKDMQKSKPSIQIFIMKGQHKWECFFLCMKEFNKRNLKLINLSTEGKSEFEAQ